MLRSPKRSKNGAVAPKEKEELILQFISHSSLTK
jgi:hypothetical protein